MQLRVTEAVHLLLASVVEAGDLVVDATAGNGHDTSFLAETVGEAGRVIAFDVQQLALDATAERLRSLGLSARVDLVRSSHDQLGRHIDPDGRRAAAVMFNLGYLPGGADRSTVTRPHTTTAAINAALDRLRPEGVVSVVCYRGHDGGVKEAEAVLELTGSLDPKRFTVSTYKMLSAADEAPFALFIQRRS